MLQAEIPITCYKKWTLFITAYLIKQKLGVKLMFYIKLDENMDLVVTVREPLFRGDNLNRKLIYLVPLTVGDIDILSAYVYLNYVRADGVADVVILERMEEKYNESYYQYTMPVTCKLTRYPGEVCTWIHIYTGNPSNPSVQKTGECILQIQDSKNMDDYLCDHQMTALYQLHAEMDDAVDNVCVMLDEVNTALERKADNIVFHAEDNTIQLSANGEPIGDRIAVQTSTGAVVTDAGISPDGELILAFSDGSTKNLGSVVGKDGAVYVPHVSERKILTFTIEDEPAGVPDPVDLNPSDEWSSIDGSEVVTDYTWEKL